MPHPKVTEFYNKYNTLDHYEKAEDKRERDFRAKTDKSAHSYKITGMYRSKKGGFRSQEYLWYFREDNSTDKHGNEIQLFEVIGKYDMPIATFQYDEAAQKSTAIGIARFDTVYEILWSPKVIDDLLEKEQVTGTTMFYLETPSRTYGDIDFEDFKGMSYEELVGYCRTGDRPEKITAAQPQQQQTRSKAKDD